MVTAFFPTFQYAAGCFVKSADGALHVTKGMVGSFDVIAARDTGVAPSVDGVVTLAGSHIGVQGAVLRSGVHTLRIVSSNPRHQASMTLRLTPGDYPLFYAVDEADAHAALVKRKVTIEATHAARVE